MFKDQNEIKACKERANADYIKKREGLDEHLDYMTAEEERVIALHYEYEIKKFCGSFQPPITMQAVVVCYFFSSHSSDLIDLSLGHKYRLF